MDKSALVAILALTTILLLVIFTVVSTTLEGTIVATREEAELATDLLHDLSVAVERLQHHVDFTNGCLLEQAYAIEELHERLKAEIKYFTMEENEKGVKRKPQLKWDYASKMYRELNLRLSK